MHGNPGSGDDWRPFMEQLGGFVRAVAPDMPGYGQAAKPPDFNYTVAGYAEHIAALVAALGLERVHLVLHDFGGPWGLTWAALNPAKVASLTLFNIGILPGYRWHYMARIWRTPIIGELFQAMTTRTGFNLALKHGNPRGLPRDFVDRMVANLDAGTHRAVRKLYRATNDLGAAARQLGDALRPLDLETLVIWGKADPYLPYRYAEMQREYFPRARINTLDDSGHWPFADNADAVSALLVPFLREQLGTQPAAQDEPRS
jgi:pimeloyl-ACP methyl ester carboxylesterase